jgi:SAM-dependent methyltransferase
MPPQTQYPALYHAHHSLYQEDLPFWLSLAAQVSGPILELGCGTGRILAPLAAAGRVAFGLDNDRDMLRFCAAQLAAMGIPARLLQADMCHFHFASQFRLILLPCNTLSALADSEVQAMLSCVSRHLQPGAVFAASLPNPKLLAYLPKSSPAEIEEVFAHPVDGEPVQVSSAWERDGQIFTLRWYYDHLLPDGQVERVTAVVKHHLRSVQVYLDSLIASGFEIVHLYGDFNRAPYQSHAPNLIIVARSTSG